MGKEIERKFLVKTIPVEMGSGVEIQQGYICENSQLSIRIRLMGDNAVITLKDHAVGPTCVEFEYSIPYQDATELITYASGHLIEKTRFNFNDCGSDWVVDVFGGINSGLVLAEIELVHEKQEFTKPAWLGREITYDTKYYNSFLSKKPFTKQ